MVDDFVPMNNSTSATCPSFQIIVAANLFRRIAGMTLDTFLQSLKPSHAGGKRLQRRFYNVKIDGTAKSTQLQLEDRIAGAGLDCTRYRDNLPAITSSTPLAHRITYLKYGRNGLPPLLRGVLTVM